MSAVKAIFGWLGSKLVLYGALVLAILAGAVVGPWFASEWTRAHVQAERIGRLEAAKGALDAEREATQQRLVAAVSSAQRKSVDDLDRAIAEALEAKAAAEGRRRGDLARTKSLLAADSEALLAEGRLELEIQYRDRGSRRPEGDAGPDHQARGARPVPDGPDG